MVFGPGSVVLLRLGVARPPGAAIFGIAGLITNNRYGFLELSACYSFFTLVAFFVWQGNIWLIYENSTTGDLYLTEYVGIAAPIMTPTASQLRANKIGQLP